MERTQAHPSICKLQSSCPVAMTLLAEEVLESAAGQPIACIDIPELFFTLCDFSSGVDCALLDARDCWQDIKPGATCVRYDYCHPQSVDRNLQHHFAVVVAETPYHTELCALGILQTMQLLIKNIFCPKYYMLTKALLRSAEWEDLGMRPVRCGTRLEETVGQSSWVLYTNCPRSSQINMMECEE